MSKVGGWHALDGYVYSGCSRLSVWVCEYVWGRQWEGRGLRRGQKNTWTLHHDNAPAHVPLLIREFFKKHETSVVPQPPYSPDLAPEEFLLFSKLKSSLKVRRFQRVEEMEENSIRDLRAITQNTFQDAFQNWKKNVGCGVSRVEGSALKEAILIKL